MSALETLLAAYREEFEQGCLAEGMDAGAVAECRRAFEADHLAELEQATNALVRERLRMHEERQRAEVAEARLAKVPALVEAMKRIESTCDIVIERIAEVGPPRPGWSGTQLDPERVANVVREALAAWEQS